MAQLDLDIASRTAADGTQIAEANNASSTALSHEANGGPPAAAKDAPATSGDRGHAAHAGGDTRGMKHPFSITHPITTPGIDVSEFQKSIDWTKVPQSGAKFAFIRASDGTTIQDADFVQNWQGAEKAGLLVGAYHYFSTSSPVQTQIENFTGMLKKVDAGSLPPVLDVEDAKQFARFTVPQRVAMIQQMLDGIEKETGVQPMLYMSSSFSTNVLGKAPQFDKYKLYVADYTTAALPIVPKPWTAWNFWQHTDSGQVPGIAGGVDMDYFNGPEANLPVVKQAQPASAPKV